MSIDLQMVRADVHAKRAAESICRDDMCLSVTYEAPSSNAEKILTDIWSSVLDICPIGIDDDFFELGGDSFAATVLASQIEAQFKIPFSPADIIEYSTARAQADLLTKEANTGADDLPSFIIPCNTSGTKPPFFMIHGAAGFVFFNRDFLNTIGEDQPVYLFQAPGMDGRGKPCQTVEEFAETYIQAMRQIQPEGPYRIGATCSGGFICLEICHQLETDQQKVEKLILIDPPVRIAENRFPKLRKLSDLPRYPRLIRRWLSMNLKSLVSRFEMAQHVLAERARTAGLNRRRKTIEIRQVHQTGGARDEEQTYDFDTMLDVSSKLHFAVREYKVKPYSGHGHLLVTQKRSFNTTPESLYVQKINSITACILPFKHQSIFNENAVDLAKFIKSALQSK